MVDSRLKYLSTDVYINTKTIDAVKIEMKVRKLTGKSEVSSLIPFAGITNQNEEQTWIKERPEKNDVNLASLTDRLAAAFVDWVVLGLPIFIPLLLIYDLNGTLELSKKHDLLFILLTFLIGQALYLIVNGRLLYKYGQTFGKWCLEIKIVDLENNLPKFSKSYGLRYLIPVLFYSIPIFGTCLAMIDFLFIFRKDRRCIHDHIAGTKVIDAT